MFDRVQVSTLPPRSLHDNRLLLSRLGMGLRGYRFFGGLFTFGGLLLTGLAVALGTVPFAFLGLATAVVIGGLFLKKASSEKKHRQSCLSLGRAIVGRVTGHSRAFNPFSSRGLYTIQIQTDSPAAQHTAKHTSKNLTEAFPVGCTVLGFELDGRLIWGPEIGVIFELVPPPLP
ncbi:MAG: hypothetical protein IPK32_13390 [Verrucomicrobiaceae bacterium]|nr:hypothetical protein [Verrucomicrobiaceae bacterium]